MLSRKQAAVDSLPDYGSFYFANVLADYQSLPKQDADESARAIRETADLIVKKGNDVTCTDLFTLETAVVRLQPIERLRRRACILRQKYRSLVGEQAYQAYLACSPLDPQTAKPEELRADMEQLLSEFHWHYSAVKTRECLFHDLQRRLVTPILVYMLATLAWALWYIEGESGTIPTLPVVVLAGVLGAFTSILRRLQTAQSQSVAPAEDMIGKLSELGLGRLGVFMALASGAIFSSILYLIFIGQMVQGSFFPEIVSPEAAPGTSTGLAFSKFVTATDPRDGVEFAKLLVWSFISGFAERFVPDVLDRLTTRDAQAGASATPRPSPAPRPAAAAQVNIGQAAPGATPAPAAG